MLSVSIVGGGAVEPNSVGRREMLTRLTIIGAERFELVVHMLFGCRPLALRGFAAPLLSSIAVVSRAVETPSQYFRPAPDWYRFYLYPNSDSKDFVQTVNDRAEKLRQVPSGARPACNSLLLRAGAELNCVGQGEKTLFQLGVGSLRDKRPFDQFIGAWKLSLGDGAFGLPGVEASSRRCAKVDERLRSAARERR